eukprot:m51a1_g8424 hypothetical protein (339) ;mRNA; r:329778-331258
MLPCPPPDPSPAPATSGDPPRAARSPAPEFPHLDCVLEDIARSLATADVALARSETRRTLGANWARRAGLSLALASRACRAAVERAYAALAQSRWPGAPLDPSLLALSLDAAARAPLTRPGPSPAPAGLPAASWRGAVSRVLRLAVFDAPAGATTATAGRRAADVRASEGPAGAASLVRKAGDARDSNNVLVHAPVVPGSRAFVEFWVVRSQDECSVGVSPDAAVARLSGWENLKHPLVWSYSRSGRSTSMPAVQLGSVGRIDTVKGFARGDLVGIFVEASLRKVTWYRNGRAVACNLPTAPLPPPVPPGYRIFCMLDMVDDEVAITRVGFSVPDDYE